MGFKSDPPRDPLPRRGGGDVCRNRDDTPPIENLWQRDDAYHREREAWDNRPRVREFSYLERDLLNAREDIERQQARLDKAHQEFRQLLDDEPALAMMWKKFESNGGVDAEQLKQFIKGKMRPRIITKRGNLRLISDRPGAKNIVHHKIRHNHDDDGPNAA
jgi:hypothetical protein